MKSSRPRIKFLQLPHSVAQRLESLTNRTAVALLSLICRKTIGFGQGVVELSYKHLSKALKVGTRAISKAAKLLEAGGDIIRERDAGSIYRWSVVLDKEEILEDPNHTYTIRNSQPPTDEGVRITRSGPSCTSDHDPPGLPIMTPRPLVERSKPCKIGSESTIFEQDQEALKISIKDTYIKKQQQDSSSLESAFATNSPAVCKTTDDEPLHKFCLRELRKLGVSQRVARQLCKEHDHKLIASVIKTAPQRPGIKNQAAYIVSEIRDGGYEHPQNSPSAPHRNNPLKTEVDAPITYPSAKQTKAERAALEAQKLEQEKSYLEKAKTLAARFKNLSEDLQLQLKLTASVYLSQMLPSTGNREQMLRDKTFQRLANRTVLEQFFQWIDQGLEAHQALNRFKTKAIPA